MKRLPLLCLIFTFFSLSQAHSMLPKDFYKTIYTDDSTYFLKLHKDGFTQRVQFNQKYCKQINSISVKFKSNSPNQNSHSKFIAKGSNRWPETYGTKNFTPCWFEVTANGLDLNKPEQNLYVLQVHLNNGESFYIQDIGQSILMENRIASSSIRDWFSLGQAGATPVKGGGIFYKLWEPTAEEVHLFLSPKSEKVILKKDGLPSPRTSHVIYLENSKVEDKYYYKFVKNGSYEVLETANDDTFSDIKVDPMAKGLTYQSKGGKHNGYIKPQAVVKAPFEFDFKYDHLIQNLNKPDRDNWIIYQIWPLTFNPKKKNGRYQSGTFKDVQEKIPYLHDLGITSVEFLPIHESRFYASWGYAMDSIMLLDSGYGSPKQFQELVDELHSKKIRVILDVVLNHINNHLIRDPLSETVSESKYYKGNTGWGPKPRFEYSQVRKWILDSLLSLIRDYHIDGFRYDMVEHIYLHNPQGYKFLQELNTLLRRENVNFYSSAEQLPDNVWATYPVSNNGLAFDSQWNDKFKNFFELEFDHYRENNRSLNIFPLVGSLKGYSNQRVDGQEQHFGSAMRTVNYLGSHDVVGNKNPILRIVSNYESYEWEGQNHFSRVRPLEATEHVEAGFRQIHNDFTHSVGRAGYGTLFTKPGASLFFQGEEMANDINIENEWSYINAKEGNTIPTQNVDIHRYLKSHRVPWEYLDPRSARNLSFLSDDEVNLFKGYHLYFKEMIKFRKEHPEFNETDAKDVKTYFYNQAVTWRLGNNTKEYFVVLNLGNRVITEWLDFPGNTKDWWKEVYNSSVKKYGSSSDAYRNVISNVGGRSNNVRIDGSSIIVFKKQPHGSLNDTLYLRGDLNNWNADSNYRLNMASDHGDIYVVNFQVPKTSEYKFKLGSKNWEIDLGQAPENSLRFIPEEISEGKGYLSYIPGLPNIKVNLEKGSYKFLFNIKTYKYNFIKNN